MTDMRPAHIIDHIGDRSTRCGRKDKEMYPVVLARHVQAHINGHDMPVCAECAKGGWPT
jgi:hypothetical protein